MVNLKQILDAAQRIQDEYVNINARDLSVTKEDWYYLRNKICMFEQQLREEKAELETEVEAQRSEDVLLEENEKYGSKAVFDAGYVKGTYEKLKEILGEA